MGKSKTPLTPYEAYKKEYKRLQQAIRRQRKKGYDISAEDVAVKTPGQLKKEFGLDYNYQAEIEALKAFTPEQLRNIAIAKQEDDWGYEDEPYPPEDSTLNQAIIDMFTELFMEPTMPSGNPNFVMRKLKVQNTLKAIWEDTLDSTDPYILAAILEENAYTIKSVVERLQYDSESNVEEAADLSLIVEILNGGSPLSAEQADQINESAMWYGAYDNLRGGL